MVRQKKSMRWPKYVYVWKWDMCWRNFCVFSLVTKNVKSRVKNNPCFKWGPFWNLVFKNKNYYIFQKEIIETTTNRHNFACDNYIFPKARTNKTSSGPIWVPLRRLSLSLIIIGSAMFGVFSNLVTRFGLP